MPGHDLILFDGVCGFCNRTVRFVIPRDKSDRFRFAALQSPTGTEALARHGISSADLDTVYLLTDWNTPEEKMLSRAMAVLHILTALGGFSGFLARLLGILPQPFLDAGYRVIARYRYRIFGKYESCPLPTPEERRKFVDV